MLRKLFGKQRIPSEKLEQVGLNVTIEVAERTENEKKISELKGLARDNEKSNPDLAIKIMREVQDILFYEDGYPIKEFFKLPRLLQKNGYTSDAIIEFSQILRKRYNLNEKAIVYRELSTFFKREKNEEMTEHYQSLSDKFFSLSEQESELFMSDEKLRYELQRKYRKSV